MSSYQTVTAKQYDNYLGSRSIQDRKESSNFELKKACNAVKTRILNKYAPRICEKVWDIACGNFGDGYKLSNLGVKEYVGIDISQERIKTAIERSKSVTIKKIELACADFLDSSTWPKYLQSNVTFDLINMQFCLHYFISNSLIWDQWLAQISQKLKKKGTWIVTIVNWNKLVKLIFGGKTFQNSCCIINPYPKEEQKHAWFRYGFHLKDCVASDEFSVHVDHLIARAKQVRLECVKDGQFENMVDIKTKIFGTNSKDQEQIFDLYEYLIFEKY